MKAPRNGWGTSKPVARHLSVINYRADSIHFTHEKNFPLWVATHAPQYNVYCMDDPAVGHGISETTWGAQKSLGASCLSNVVKRLPVPLYNCGRRLASSRSGRPAGSPDHHHASEQDSETSR